MATLSSHGARAALRRQPAARPRQPAAPAKARHPQTRARLRQPAARRRARLAGMPEILPEGEEEEGATADQEAERHDDVGYVRLLPKDFYEIDIDEEFKGFKTEDGALRSIKKPANWQRAVDLASEVLLNEMRTLFETGDGPLYASSCSFPW